MKPKKHPRRKPLPLALVVDTALAIQQSRPENRDKPLAELIEPAIEFIRAAEHLIAAHKSDKK
jgi:hypothetical protein